jgi:predicted nuclease with TOPRIM domain
MPAPGAALNELHSQDAAITGLQNELKTMRTQAKTLEEKFAIYTGLNNDLKSDKENLRKQLELVTLRRPRVGFWALLFGKNE